MFGSITSSGNNPPTVGFKSCTSVLCRDNNALDTCRISLGKLCSVPTLLLGISGWEKRKEEEEALIQQNSYFAFTWEQGWRAKITSGGNSLGELLTCWGWVCGHRVAWFLNSAMRNENCRFCSFLTNYELILHLRVAAQITKEQLKPYFFIFKSCCFAWLGTNPLFGNYLSLWTFLLEAAEVLLDKSGEFCSVRFLADITVSKFLGRFFKIKFVWRLLQVC